MKIITIKDYHEHKFKEKGSQFIGQAFPTLTQNEAEDFLSSVRKEHYNATHHCYAYLLKDGQSKFSDDGEPNGTAGKRILNAIQHFNLKDVLVIVIRYYGGTKLGVGPLGKAYYLSAESVLGESNKIELEEYSRIKIPYDYNFSSHLHHFIGQYKAIKIENGFEELPFIKCSVKVDSIDKLQNNLIEASNGKIKIEIINKSEFH